MLFLGLGTGLGSTIIVDGVVEPMELGHLPYKKRTYEDYVGRAGLMRHGKKRWRSDVADVVARLVAALEPDETVLGGGNVKKLETLPPNCRAGDNANAFRGGFKLWEAAPLSREPGLVRNEARGGSERTPRPTAKADTFSRPSTSKDAAWRALEAHHASMSGQRLRDLFSDDPTRGERMTAEAAGVFLDYSKNRINDETLKLLIELAEQSGLRAKIEAMFRGEKINVDGKSRRPACRPSRPERRDHNRRWRERRDAGPRRARQDGRLRSTRPKRSVERPQRRTHSQRRQYRHRRLRPRAGDGV